MIARPPLLSVVLTGRNDEYGAGFTSRFLSTLAFNHRHLAAAGVAHEFVFVEWNPVAHTRWLADIVREELPELRGIFRAYLVDPRYHDALRLNPRLEFLEFPAKNVGIRRSRGRFVLTTNCDIYLGRRVIERIATEELEPAVVYRAPRIDLKFGADLSSIDWSALEDTRNHASRTKKLRPPYFFGGTGDFILLDRQSLEALGGFNEIYRIARIRLDVNFIVKAYRDGYRIADIGDSVYHVNHCGSFRLTRRVYLGREQEAPWGDVRWPAETVIYENGDTWGLTGAPERPMREGKTWIDFDWSAVAPLVDLRKVVLAPSESGRPDACSLRS